MVRRRLLYLAVWIGCLVFYCAYQQWFAWFALMGVLALPLLSLVLSLPAMLTARFRLELPAMAPVGTQVWLDASCRCRLPIPPWTARITVTRPMTGESWRLSVGDLLPTEHCGQLVCTVKKAGFCDYLGLFRLPFLKNKQMTLLVRPVPCPMEGSPILGRCQNRAWKPKPGGGYAENHELRLYRPGDSVRQIHWKLSSKTGKVILREPMEPVRNRVLLRLDLKGTAAELDRKLGQLLWLGDRLLESDIHFEVQAMTGSGLECCPVTCRQQLWQALDLLVGCPPAEGGSIHDRPERTGWLYEIGGDGGEA